MYAHTNVGIPAQKAAVHRQSVGVLFCTPDFLNAVSSSRADLGAKGAYEAIREFMTPRELALSWGLGKVLRGALHLTKLVNDDVLNVIDVNAKDPTELRYHIQPMLDSDLFTNEIRAYLQSPTDSIDEEKPYLVSMSGNNLLIGVKPGFLQFMDKKASSALFYRDCLELCLTRVREDALRETELYSQFVAQTLNF